MLRLLPLAGLSHAITWTVEQADQNLTAVWPANDGDGNAGHKSAGGIWQFNSPKDAIVNGTGSCDITISNMAVNFIHFFDADVGAYDVASQKWTVHAMGAWEDQGSYNFLVMGDQEPAEGDLTIECQNDTPVADGDARLSSFPRDPDATGTQGSFRIQGRDYTSNPHSEGEPATGFTDVVVLSFPVGSGPANFTVNDARLAVEQVGDAVTISNLGFANFYDVWFEFDFALDNAGNRLTVASYEIDIQVLAAP